MPNKFVKPIQKGQIQRGLAPRPESISVTSEGLADRIETELSGEGIVLFDNSEIMNEFLRLPADLTEVTSRDLGRYFNTFTKQKLWVRTLLSRTSAMLRDLEEDMDNLRSTIFRDLPPKMSVTEKELHLRERAEDKLKEVAFLEEKRKMLSDYLENLMDGIICISREITRRESDWNDEKRDHSIGGKRK